MFDIGSDSGTYDGHSVVGDGVPLRFQKYSWQAMMPRISSWLAGVKHDLATPDLWAELQRENKLLGAISDDTIENTPFTPHEQKEIAARLRELLEQVRQTYSLSETQMRVLDAKLDYLVNAAGRLGRKDWLIVFAGVIFSFTVATALPPESTRAILLSLLQVIGNFLGLPAG